MRETEPSSMDIGRISEWPESDTETVIGQLSDLVRQGEQERQSQHDDTLHDLFDAVTAKVGPEERPLHELLTSRLGLSPLQTDLLIGGFLHVGLLDLTGTIDQMKQTTSLKEIERLAGQLARPKNIIDQIGFAKAPPFSPQGTSFIYAAEFAQNFANAAAAQGQKSEAQIILESAITDNQARLHAANQESIDFTTPDLELRESNYPMYKRRKEFVGSLWVQPVLSARLGRLTFDQPTMARSVKEAQTAFHYEQNGARLATLAIWSGAASLSAKFVGSPVSRLEGFIVASKAFRQAEKVDKDGSRNALRQFIDHRLTPIKGKLHL